ncbi:MAG: DPP IV N-terminal domain-containing protein, partial [Bacteroidia bacterium]
AQDKIFTIEEAVLGGGGKLIPKNLDQLQWVAETSNYSQTVKNAIEVNNARDGKWIKSISKADIDGALKDSGWDTLKRMPRVTWLNANNFKFNHANKVVAYDIAKKTAYKLVDYNPEEMENADFSYNSLNVAYTKGNNLYINEKQISFDDKPGMVNGQSVHRNEFGIVKGTFWSNDGQQLAFYHLDEHMVAEYPIYQLKTRPADTRTIRYPIAGTPSHHASVGVYNTSSNTIIFLKTGEPLEQYLTNITWSPDNKSVYVAIVNRAQNHMWLNQYDATNGNFIKTLFEETNDKYVEPEHGPVFLKTDPNKFIWWSERDGYNHLYLYDISGKLISQITKGSWVVTELNGFDKSGKTLFYTSTGISPTERHLVSVNLKTNKTMLLTYRPGTHTLSLSPNGDFFIDHFQNATVPREIRILSADGQKQTVLHTATNPLTDYKLGETTMGTLKASDGTDLYYRLIKPINFNPDAKYPVVVYLYNGPHLQLVNNTWLSGANLWMQYMAQHGYYVFTIDGRGSLNRGHAFEAAVHRQVGTLEMEDQLKGVEFLKSLPNVDAARIGIHGWSYGGFMTTSLMTRNAGVYKVGVAGGPVIDWGLYEIMYTERYMDTPEENPDGYKNNNLLNYTKNLKGKLLMIHGGEDDVVLWQHSLQYLEKCIKDGVQLDYFVYPHHPHNVGGKDRVHLMDKISRYFFDNL